MKTIIPLAVLLSTWFCVPAGAGEDMPPGGEATTKGIIDGEYDLLPEQAFYMVGSIEEAVEQGKKMQAKAA